jgi:peptide deformylase
LEQNYPNPFNPVTKISYSIPRSSKVVLKVFDVSGREVATLENSERAAGIHQVTFDAHHLASGVYYYRLVSDGFVQTKKIVLTK